MARCWQGPFAGDTYWHCGIRSGALAEAGAWGRTHPWLVSLSPPRGSRDTTGLASRREGPLGAQGVRPVSANDEGIATFKPTEGREVMVPGRGGGAFKPFTVHGSPLAAGGGGPLPRFRQATTIGTTLDFDLRTKKMVAFGDVEGDRMPILTKASVDYCTTMIQQVVNSLSCFALNTTWIQLVTLCNFDCQTFAFLSQTNP